MQRSRSLLLALFAAVCLMAQLQTAPAAIVATGDVDPDPAITPWTVTTEAYVGLTAVGTLTVDSGSDLLSGNGYIGFESGSTGEVTVTGADSEWTQRKRLYVGYFGMGTLNINGGAVVDATGYLDPQEAGTYIAYRSGSTGVVTVTGVGSTWTNWDSLYVGQDGAGILRITSGAAVRNGSGYIGRSADSTGMVTVDDTGSTWTNKGFLYVGKQGDGMLAITGGGTVHSHQRSYIGYGPDSTGVVTVGGAGSRWGSGNDLIVGRDGDGMLGISDGGVVGDFEDASIGASLGSTGVVTVTGAGSTWGTLRRLFLGYHGNGTLTIADGGTVSNDDDSYIGYESGSTGVVTVTGTGSTWASDDRLYVGLAGNGTLSISNGGAVSQGNARIDGKAGSTGVVTVSGIGSTWTSRGDLVVGSTGKGTLSVSNGGVVSQSTGCVGNRAGSMGMVTVSGSSSTWASRASLYIGNDGDGKLRIADGGAVIVDNSTYVGFAAESTGVIEFGPGAAALTTQSLYVSPTQLIGAGVINAHGLVGDLDLVFDSDHGASQTLTLANHPGQNVTVNLDMTDPSHVGDLGAGYHGHGSLTIRDGITVNSYRGSIADQPGSTGVARVDGAGSTWANSGHSFSVGYNGNGTLTISRGGTVNSDSSYIGNRLGSTGAVTVDGAGSTWASSDDLFIGGGGNGTLNITGGGAVVAREAKIQGPSLVAIDVANDSTLTLDAGIGGIYNHGTVRVIAGAGAEAGTVHAPIAAGTWTGDGDYQALGGTWDEIDHVFTVSDVEQASAGAEVVIDLAQQQRVMIDDAETGWSVGASFLAMPESTLLGFEASPIGGEILDGLEELLRRNAFVLGGWEFTTTGGYTPGDPAYLSLDIGPGFSREDLLVWHRDGADWSQYAAVDLTYDGTYASFTVTDFSGYAVTTVPEPATMTLLLLGLVTMTLVAGTRWGRKIFDRLTRATTLRA